MPSELQSPNWNEAKIDPMSLAAGTAAALEGLAKQHNENPSKFMAMQKGGGDIMGIGDMRSNNPMYDQKVEQGVSSSNFLLMGKGRTKKDARREQLLSGRNALGMDLSYKEKMEASRILRGGRAKKNNDPFSGGGSDRDIAADARITRQSLGVEGGYVSPQGIVCNEHMARQLGGGEYFQTMLDARREETAPAEYRALNGAADGNDKLKDAAKQVGDDVKVKFVAQLDDPKPMANLLLSQEETNKIKPPKPNMSGPKPNLNGPSPNGPSASGLMEG